MLKMVFSAPYVLQLKINRVVPVDGLPLSALRKPSPETMAGLTYSGRASRPRIPIFLLTAAATLG